MKVQHNAMPMYRIVIISLFELRDDCVTVQKRYADGGYTVGSLDLLKKIFESSIKHGPDFGYHHSDCHILEKAQHIFEHDKVEIVDGCRVLGNV